MHTFRNCLTGGRYLAIVFGSYVAIAVGVSILGMYHPIPWRSDVLAPWMALAYFFAVLGVLNGVNLIGSLISLGVRLDDKTAIVILTMAGLGIGYLVINGSWVESVTGASLIATLTCGTLRTYLTTPHEA